MAYFKLEISWGKEQKKQTLHTDEMKGWEWVKLEVERVREMGRYKTASNYLTAARSWTRYLGREDWVFSEMTVDKVTAYQRWLSERDICLNTISAYMRALRVMYHRAMETDYDPFAQVFTGRAKTRKRSLSPDDIQQLHALELPHGSQLALARDIFLFSFYAMGMPFVRCGGPFACVVGPVRGAYCALMPLSLAILLQRAKSLARRAFMVALSW